MLPRLGAGLDNVLLVKGASFTLNTQGIASERSKAMGDILNVARVEAAQ